MKNNVGHLEAELEVESQRRRQVGARLGFGVVEMLIKWISGLNVHVCRLRSRRRRETRSWHRH